MTDIPHHNCAAVREQFRIAGQTLLEVANDPSRLDVADNRRDLAVILALAAETAAAIADGRPYSDKAHALVRNLSAALNGPIVNRG